MNGNDSGKTRIAILGAGPIGVEAALFAMQKGYEVDLYERDRPGAHLEQWGHVRFFSPWSLNRSPWGVGALDSGAFDSDRLDPEAFPTGREYLDEYLLPLIAATEVGEGLHVGSRVVGVSRRDALKGDFIGDARRADGPFLLLIEEAAGRRYAEADIVIDASGVCGQPNSLGPGGLPALGEEAVSGRIERRIPDALGRDRAGYEGRTTLLVGNGFSAVSTAFLLAELHREAPETRVLWLLRDDLPPYSPIPGDSLPERLKLARFGNDAACGKIEGIEPVFGQLRRLRGGESADAPIVAEVSGGGGTQSFDVDCFEVDRIVGNVGYRPDLSLYRELQIHQCYASEGPMKLAASLLAKEGAGGDCLAQTTGGFDTLRSPEPDFYFLGAKSYGRGSAFLLKLGFAQIEELFEGIESS